MLIATGLFADKLEDAAQLLIDRGLAAWEKGDLPGARASFARARDLLPEKPNPYRLLALADQKLGQCDVAVAEADRFLALAAADDSRRNEVRSIRESCVRPSPTPAIAKPSLLQPAPTARKRPTNIWRNSAIASLVIGAAGIIAGVPLLIFVDNKAAGAVPTAVGAAGLVLTIPFFVVDWSERY
jgi:hypothetical protein